jgi:hypothetical protein
MKELGMRTHHVTPEVETVPGKVPTILIESLPPRPVQKVSPEKIIVGSEHDPQGRNSKLVGFERGAIHLQPLAGPEQF